MTWNYRIIEVDTKPVPTRELRTVYYVDDNPVYWSAKATPIQWDAGEDQRELVDMLLNAFRLPVIKEEDLSYDEKPF